LDNKLPKKALSTELLQKRLLKNVDEIDTCSQFHKHLISSFCADILVPKKLQSQIVTIEKAVQNTLV
jgi:hypothetical protein